MLYKDVVIEKGASGTNGLSLNIDGAESKDISGEVPVYLNFAGSPPIGKALVYKKNGWLYANIDITAHMPRGMTMWPCLGIRVNTIDVSKKNKIVRKFTVDNINLCSTPNNDETIEPIEL